MKICIHTLRGAVFDADVDLGVERDENPNATLGAAWLSINALGHVYGTNVKTGHEYAIPAHAVHAIGWPAQIERDGEGNPI